MNNKILNMKNLMVGTLLSVSLAGCIDMEVVPPTTIGQETFWKTEKDAWYALNACYSTLPGVGVYQDAYVDNAFCPYPWESNGSLSQLDGISAAYDEGYNFESIRSCNIFLSKVDGVDMDADVKERMKAEARFIRAMKYMDMTMTFGKVPLITDVPEYSAPNVARDEASKVRSFVLKELGDVAEILPPSYGGGYLNEKGRITKWAAYALKARAALYFGDFAAAETAASKVMTEGGFSLFKISSLNAKQQKEADEMDIYVDFAALGIDKETFMKGLFSYEALWHTENGNPNNPEYILSHEYMGGNADYADLTRYTSMRPDQLVLGWSSIVPMQDLIDAYWDAKGNIQPVPLTADEREVRYNQIREEASEWIAVDPPNRTFRKYVETHKADFKNYDYTQEFRNRDSRLYASIMFPFKGWYETDAGDDFAYEWKKGAGNESTSGYNFRKMVALSSNTLLWGDYPCAEGDYPIIRYAEILLTFAEARVMNSGWDGQVENALNELRDRCGMPHVTAKSGQDAINFVRNERRIELAGEGHRYYDLRRYEFDYSKNLMAKKTFLPDGELLADKKWTARMILMPIPQEAMDLNPLLRGDQNQGY